MTAISAFLEFSCIPGKIGERNQYLAIVNAATLLRLLSASNCDRIDNPESDLNLKFIKEQKKRLKVTDSIISYSPIMIAVFEEIEFIAIPNNPDFGLIRIPALAHLKILDGFHRVAALAAANLPHSRLISDDLPIVFMSVADDKQFQNMKKSLANREGTSRNMTNIRFQKNTLLERSRDVTAYSPFLQKAVALGKSSLAPRAQQLFPHTAFARACTPLLNALDKLDKKASDKKIAEFWDKLCQVLHPLKAFGESQITASEVRNTTVLTSTAILVALGQIGAEVLISYPDCWMDAIGQLSKLDWSRGNTSDFEGVAVADGVLVRGEFAESQTLKILKKAAIL